MLGITCNGLSHSMLWKPELNAGLISHSVHFLPGLPGLDARLVTRGEETGVSIVSTFTSGMTDDRSEVLASFSRLLLVIISVPLCFSEILSVGSNFWVIISYIKKTNQSHNLSLCDKVNHQAKVSMRSNKVQLTFLSAGGVVGGGVIARGEGSVAVRAACEQTKLFLVWSNL